MRKRAKTLAVIAFVLAFFILSCVGNDSDEQPELSQQAQTAEVW
jgi:hypothetical protein